MLKLKYQQLNVYNITVNTIYFWYLLNTKKVKSKTKYKTYLTPSRWNGKRVDTNFWSTLLKLVSGIRRSLEVDFIWLSKAVNTILGNGSTCKPTEELSWASFVTEIIQILIRYWCYLVNENKNYEPCQLK